VVPRVPLTAGLGAESGKRRVLSGEGLVEGRVTCRLQDERRRLETGRRRREPRLGTRRSDGAGGQRGSEDQREGAGKGEGRPRTRTDVSRQGSLAGKARPQRAALQAVASR